MGIDRELKSTDSIWVSKIGKEWYTGDPLKFVSNLEQCHPDIEWAVSLVESAGTIGSLSLPYPKSSIADLHAGRVLLSSFALSIHYEVSEKIDSPLGVSLGDTLEAATELDPDRFEVIRERPFWFDEHIKLIDLVDRLEISDQLKDDLKNKLQVLDDDELSESLQQDIIEARYWDEEFVKSRDCAKAAEAIFTPDVRANWETMTADDRTALLAQYAEQVGVIMGEGNDIIGSFLPDITGNGYGSNNGLGTVRINELFVTGNVLQFDLDKAIETVTHEVRHQEQSESYISGESIAVSPYNPPVNLIEEWRKPYPNPTTNYTEYFAHAKERDARGFAALAAPAK